MSSDKFKLARWAVLLFLVVLSSWIHCSERKRSNPIDPQNPVTKGKPTGLRVISEYNKVILSWDRIQVEDLVGYNIYRRSSGDSLFRKIYLCLGDCNRYEDENVMYDITYSYQISVVTSSYESPRSDVVSITPGPTFIWMTDADNREVIKITHDGLHEIFRVSTGGYPLAISVNPHEGSAWVTDVLNNRLLKISHTGELFWSQISFSEPIDAAVERTSGSVWVADQYSGKVMKLDSSGTELFVLEGFKEPVSVSINQSDGSCWVADVKDKRVFKISPDGTHIQSIGAMFYSPQAVAVNSTDGSCWVADSSRVLKLNSMGHLTQVSGNYFNYARALAVNSRTNECWVLDLKSGWGASKLRKLDPEGRLVLTVEGFTVPRTVAVNLYDNSVVVTDSGYGRIVRISSQGKIVSELANFYYPFGVDVEY